MAAKRKRGLGYDGCGTDLVVFAVLAALAIWGIGRWNARETRPFGLGRVPIPHPVRMIEHGVKYGIDRFFRRRSTVAPSPSPTALPTPMSSPSATPPSAAPSVVATPVPAATASPASPSASPSVWTVPVDTPSAAPEAVKVAAAISTVKADIHASADPLSANATALLERGSMLYMGLPDGGIAFRDRSASGKAGTVVRPAGATGAVQSLATEPDSSIVWVTVGNAGSGQIFTYAPKTKTTHTIDLSPLGPGVAPPNQITVLAGPGKNATLALTNPITGGAPLFLDAATGAQVEASSVLPADAVTALTRPQTAAFFSNLGVRGTQTLLTISGDGVAPGSPPAVFVWTNDGTRWESRPVDGAEKMIYNRLRLSDPGGAGVSVLPDSIALLTSASGGQTLAAATIWTLDTSGSGPVVVRSAPTLPDGVFGLWAASDRIAHGPSGLWWTFAGAVLHSAKTDGTGPVECFLPWNGAGDDKHGHIAALIADADGAWVATDTGTHHIVPGHPDTQVGYGGYVRAPLGPDAGRVPSAPISQKLAALSQQWSGVPYLWGGNTKAGVDCSGYVCALFGGVGITVPRATGELANGSEGKRIRDDLKFGDVLVFPGHCAMYLGNGWTTEALHPTVGKAAIWSRKSVVVKRFLK